MIDWWLRGVLTYFMDTLAHTPHNLPAFYSNWPAGIPPRRGAGKEAKKHILPPYNHSPGGGANTIFFCYFQFCQNLRFVFFLHFFALFSGVFLDCCWKNFDWKIQHTLPAHFQGIALHALWPETDPPPRRACACARALWAGAHNTRQPLGW